MGLDAFQGGVVQALNQSDKANQNLLDQVIKAAGDASNDKTMADVSLTGDPEKDKGQPGTINWGGKVASISGTGGVALLEYAKESIMTGVNNVSGIGAAQKSLRTQVERKLTA